MVRKCVREIRGKLMDIEKRIKDDVETVCKGSYDDISNLHKYPEKTANEILKKLIEWACKPQNVTPIVLARKKIDEINKNWLKQCFVDVAKECIDFSDYWEYRRLLELIVCVVPELKPLALQICEDSEDKDIREIIEDFKEI